MHYDEKERLFRSPRRAKQIDSTTQMHSLFLVKDLFWDFVFSVPHTLRQGISCALDTENTAAFAQISGVFYRPSDAETIACVSSAATANVCAKELQHRLSTGSADLKFPKMIHNAHGIPSA